MEPGKDFLRQRAQELGFILCGFTTADPPDPVLRLCGLDRRRPPWRDALSWRPNAACRPGRSRPRLLPAARSIIALAMPYPPPPEFENLPLEGRVAAYALGEDYHEFIPDRLRSFAGISIRLPAAPGNTGCTSIRARSWKGKSPPAPDWDGSAGIPCCFIPGSVSVPDQLLPAANQANTTADQQKVDHSSNNPDNTSLAALFSQTHDQRAKTNAQLVEQFNCRTNENAADGDRHVDFALIDDSLQNLDQLMRSLQPNTEFYLYDHRLQSPADVLNAVLIGQRPITPKSTPCRSSRTGPPEVLSWETSGFRRLIWENRPRRGNTWAK